MEQQSSQPKLIFEGQSEDFYLQAESVGVLVVRGWTVLVDWSAAIALATYIENRFALAAKHPTDPAAQPGQVIPIGYQGARLALLPKHARQFAEFVRLHAPG